MLYLSAIAAIHFAASSALGAMTVLSAKTLLTLRREMKARSEQN